MSDEKEVAANKEKSIDIFKDTDKNNSKEDKDKIKDNSKEDKETKDNSKSSELSVLKDIKKDEPKKAFKPIRKIRVDLVIFGILIYILGIFTGLFIGVGLSQGDLSLNSFQRFFSSADQVQVSDLGNNQTGQNANNGIVINNAASVKSGSSSVSGGLGGGSDTGGSSDSSVTHISDTPDSGSGGGFVVGAGDTEH
jgi:hypothetical protein